MALPVVGLASSGLERAHRTRMATRHGVFGTDRLAQDVDDVNVVGALLLFVGVPLTVLT